MEDDEPFVESNAAGSEVDISVVLPVYRTGEFIEELYRRLRAVLESLSLSWELLFIDDACPHGSWGLVEELAQHDPRVRGLALAQNAGQQRAVMTGLRCARGECVVIMDADLQDPPEAIPLLLDKLRHGVGAVFAGRRGRFEAPSRLFTSRIFKGLLRMVCGIPRDAGMFVALNRQMVQRLTSIPAPRPYVVGMIGCTGLPIISVPVERTQRQDGESAYSSWKRLAIGFESLFWTIIWRLGIERLFRLSPQEILPIRARAGWPSTCQEE